MTKRALTVSWIAVMAATCAQAAPWVKGYVVGFYEPAFRYGGRADYSRGTEIEPGVDCPHGSTTHFANPAMAFKALSLVPWRSRRKSSPSPIRPRRARCETAPACIIRSGAPLPPIAAITAILKPTSTPLLPKIPASRK